MGLLSFPMSATPQEQRDWMWGHWMAAGEARLHDTSDTDATDVWVEAYVRRCQRETVCPKVMMRHHDIPAFEASLGRVRKRLGITLPEQTDPDPAKSA